MLIAEVSWSQAFMFSVLFICVTAIIIFWLRAMTPSDRTSLTNEIIGAPTWQVDYTEAKTEPNDIKDTDDKG